MDFIIDLPKAKGKEVIVFAVDRLTKYAHFVGLSHPSSVITVGQAFLDNIYRLHGLPHSIVSDRDPVFISTFWRHLSHTKEWTWSYPSQIDGQTEVVNHCLETYLWCMTSKNTSKVDWLAPSRQMVV